MSHSTHSHSVLLASVATFNTHWAPFLPLRKTKVLPGPWTRFPFFPSMSFLIVPPIRNALLFPTPLFFRYIFYIQAQMPPTQTSSTTSSQLKIICQSALVGIPMASYPYPSILLIAPLTFCLPLVLDIRVCILPSDESVSSLRLAHRAFNVQSIHLVDAWMNGWMATYLGGPC